MAFSNQLKALLKKNFIMWYRNIIGSICEIFFPLFLITIIVIVRQTVPSDTYAQVSYLDGKSKLPYYISPDLKFNSTANPYFQGILPAANPFSICVRYNRPVIAFVGADPSNFIFDNVQKRLRDTLLATSIYKFQIKTFKTESDLVSYTKDRDYENDDVGGAELPGICAAIVIESATLGSSYSIKLRYEDSNYNKPGVPSRQEVPSTKSKVIDTLTNAPSTDPFLKYRDSGFTYLQMLVANAILQQETSNNNAKISVGFVPMKTPKYSDDTFLLRIVEFIPLLFILCYIAPVFRVIALVVAEKESKAREGMKMMGLKDSTYWSSWLIQYIIINIVIALCTAGIANGWLYTYSNYFYLFLWFFLFGMSLYAFAIFLAAFFYKARMASIVGCMAYFATYILGELIRRNDVTTAIKTIVSIFPPISMSLGTITIVKLEASKQGVVDSTLNEYVDDFNVSIAMIMFAIDFAIYLLLGLYLDNVMPNNEGVRKPWNFFLKSSFWCESKKIKSALNEHGKHSNGANTINIVAPEDMEGYQVQTYEKISETLKAKEAANDCMKVRNLKKEFGNGTKAVQGVTMNMYTGQIFALLGHNGAGKTTTISMLTGSLDASSGYAEVYGMPIFDNMESMRTMLGVCPQHDVLFEQLTPKEHLEIFATFKGMTDSAQIKQDIEKLLDDIYLSSAKDQQALYLSGGQKRKLSIAIAFIGNSKIILLDEPTSGMDMSSRRTVWSMLKNNKTDRIVILTTHYMDEADYLGDRIAIMAKGKIMCLGTSFYLKKELGEGYNIVLVKKENASSKPIIELIQTHISNYSILSEVSQELAIQLSKGQEKKFGALFKELDEKMEELGIESYGISVTTLEEVFLQVGEEKMEKEEEQPQLEQKVIGIQDQAPIHVEEAKLQQVSSPKNSPPENPEQHQLQRKRSHSIDHKGDLVHRLSRTDSMKVGHYTIADNSMREQGDWNLFCLHMMASLSKRLIYIKRSLVQLIIELFVPVLLVFFGLSLTLISFYYDSKPRIFDISLYPTPQRMLIGNPELLNAESQLIFFEPFTSQSGSLPSTKELILAAYKEMDEKIFNDAFGNSKNEIKRYSSLFFHKIDFSANQYEYTLFANLYSQESTACFNQIILEMILRKALNKPSFKLKIYNSPLPLTFKARDLEKRKNGNALGQSIVLAFALIPASLIAFIVREREDNLKHQQIISGISLHSYWLGNFIVDFTKSAIPCFISIGLLFAFNIELPYAWVMILGYAFSIIPFTYATSFMFGKEAVAQVGTLMIHVFFGQILAPVCLVFRMFDETRSFGKALSWILRLIPSFCLCNGIRLASSREYLASLEKLSEPKPELDMNDLAGGDLLFLFLDVVIYIVAMIVIETRIITRCLNRIRNNNRSSAVRDIHSISEFTDVAEEAKLIDEGDPKKYALMSRNLRKEYTISKTNKILAVQSISLGLKTGDCFALLGTTGAGKSTTFKMLTLDETPSSGIIYVNGKELSENFTQIRQLIGYCPQTESLFPMLTTRENLVYYGKLKGILKNRMDEVIDKLLIDMDLMVYRDILAGQLSGGNKRKLSVAIAMLGNPTIMILDEPSTGVDPKAKRFMWKVISKVTKERKNSTVIFTTHSMEEAEALSTKIGIMIRGRLRCVGPAQRIKANFGEGYEVELKIKTPTEAEIADFLRMQNLNSKDMIPRKRLEEIFDQCDISEMKSEISQTGFASDFYTEFSNKRNVSAYSVAYFVLIEKDGLAIKKEMLSQFKTITLVEHYNTYYKYRIEKEKEKNFTNGAILGYIMALAEKSGKITEYAASQTTLEQIFNTFVREDEKKQLEVNGTADRTAINGKSN